MNIKRNRVIWNFIPLKEYVAPSSKISTNLIQCEDFTKQLSTRQRNQWIRTIDWDSIATAFDLRHRLSRTGFTQVCLGLFGSAQHTLRAWASQHDAHILEPPSIDQLLDRDSELWPELRHANGITLVIPSLEKCFLRHHQGLQWIEKIIEIVWEKRCQLMIGCDLWAWKYLKSALQIDLLCDQPLISAPFDSEQLCMWLQTLLIHNNRKMMIEGEDCFATHSINGKRFFNELLERSYGCVSLAWALWQNILLGSKTGSKEAIVELCPHKPASLPSNSLSSLSSKLNLYVLHTILIHSNLSTKRVLSLLPFTEMEIRKALMELYREGVLLEEQGHWKVTAQKYFDVFQQLKNRNFWVADFIVD